MLYEGKEKWTTRRLQEVLSPPYRIELKTDSKMRSIKINLNHATKQFKTCFHKLVEYIGGSDLETLLKLW